MTTLDHGPDLSTHPEFNQPPKKSRKGLFIGLGTTAAAGVTAIAVLAAGGGKGGGNTHEGGPTPNRTTTSAPVRPSSSVEVTSPAPTTSAETSTTPEQGNKLDNTMLAANTAPSELAGAFGKVLEKGLQAGDKKFINSLFDTKRPLYDQDNELTGYDELADAQVINIEQIGREAAANYIFADCSWAHFNAGGETGPAMVKHTRQDGTEIVGGVMKCTIDAGGKTQDYYRIAVFANSGTNAQGEKVWVRQGDGPLVDPQTVDASNINPALLNPIS